MDARQPSATWTPTIVTRTKYEVFAWWQANFDRATNAPFTIYHDGGSTTVLQDQKVNGGAWVSLGAYVMAPGQNHRLELGVTADGYVIADAVKFVPVNEASASWSIAAIPATGDYKVYAKWPASGANASDATYSVTHAGGVTPVAVNQKVNGGQWNLLGTFSFATGTPGYKVELAAAGNGRIAADAIYYANDNASLDSFTWAPTLPVAGDYQLFAKWPAGIGNAGTAHYTITHDGGASAVDISQRNGGEDWVWLGSYAMDPVNNPEVTLTASNDGPVAADAVRFVAGDAVGGDVVYTHSDQLGTIQKLTDANGALAWDRIARPFGETVSISAASGVTQMQRFPGQYADETGLSYNYFRDYDPTLGRYLQSDPISLLGGVNTYGYVGGNPVSWIDPTGLGPTGAIIGAAVGGVTGGIVGGIVGGVAGGAGGTVVLPGAGTITGGGLGAVEGAIGGTEIGGAVGAAVGSALEDIYNWLKNRGKGESGELCPPWVSAEKAPGKPTEADGYTPPKGWDGKKRPNPNGSGYGYPDNKGNVWIPTGAGSGAHGGPHWDVQKPGGGYDNVLPGGRVRPGKRMAVIK